MFGLIIGIVLLVLIGVGLFDSFTIIPQNFVGLPLLFGRYTGDVKSTDPTEMPKVWRSGLHFKLPYVMRVVKVSLAQQILDMPDTLAITRDNTDVTIKASMNWHVTNAAAFSFGNEDSVKSVVDQTSAEFRGIIGGMELDETIHNNADINEQINEKMNSLAGSYGIKVDRVNLLGLDPAPEIQKAMDRLVQSDREKKATITKAEGDKQAVILQNEAQNQATLATSKNDQERNKIENDIKIATANADKIRVETAADAEKYRVETLNQALQNVSEQYLIAANIDAATKLAEGENNTIVMPSSQLDSLSNVPATANLWETTTAATKTPRSKKTVSKKDQNS